MTDSDRDVRWMSYAEAAQALGVNPESVAKRMRRDGWARGRGNDGKPRVAVPVDLLPVPVYVLDKPDNPANSAPSVSDIVPVENPNTAIVLALTERAARAEGEAAELRETLGRERERADSAEKRIQALEVRLEELRAEGEAARLQGARTEERAEGLRLVLEEARRPFWRRWIG